MAKFTFNLPDIGEGIAEAEIVAWHVAVGALGWQASRCRGAACRSMPAV